MATFGFLSLVPVGISLLAIVFLRKVALGLFLGAISGFILLLILSPEGQIAEPLRLLNREHWAVLLFAILMGCLNGLLQRAGALSAFYTSAKNVIHDRRSAQLVTCAFSAPSVFEESQAGLTSSSTLRSTFDYQKLSRAKLSFLTDQVSSITPSLTGMSLLVAFFTSLLSEAQSLVGVETDAHRLVLMSIPFQYYSWFSLFALLIVALSGREFGPMYHAELQALRSTKATKTIRAKPSDITGLILFYGSLLAFLVGIFLVQLAQGLATNSHGLMALPVGASFALFFAVLFSLFNQRIDPEGLLGACVSGVRNVTPALLIMIMAWALSDCLMRLGTAHFIHHTILVSINPILLPMLSFALAALASMAIGINYGAFALIVPLVMPAIMMMSNQETLILATIASILGGVLFGGHCSELYENTTQSAMGSRVDISRHMRSKLPYTLLSAGLTLIISTLLNVFDKSLSWSLPIGFLVLLIVIFSIGKRVFAARGRFLADLKAAR